MVSIKLENAYLPRLEISHYQKEITTLPPTLADFGTCVVVVPVQMMRDHVTSDSIIVTPEDKNGPQHMARDRLILPATRKN